MIELLRGKVSLCQSGHDHDHPTQTSDFSKAGNLLANQEFHNPQLPNPHSDLVCFRNFITLSVRILQQQIRGICVVSRVPF